MKEIKEAINYQEFLKVTKNPPRKLNMELDKLLQDRYNNNSYTLYRRNELVLHKSKDCNGKIKNILDKKWKEEPEKIKEFFKILASDHSDEYWKMHQLSDEFYSYRSQQLPLHYYEQSIPAPISYEGNQPQPLLLPSQLQTDDSCCWQMYQSPDEFYYPQPLPLQQPEPLPDDEQYDQPQSPPYELYFNDFD
ncbi:21770_t:CDS:2 [Rhizophagus irregularis]|nr:21770_t:CDS:2 [Rhizophagus irregularis]